MATREDKIKALAAMRAAQVLADAGRTKSAAACLRVAAILLGD